MFDVANVEAFGSVINGPESKAQDYDCVVDYEQADETDEDPAEIDTICPDEATKDE